jgi:tRNA modification GTPase
MKTCYFAKMNQEDIIIAIGSGEAPSAIHLIRISGKGCIAMTNRVFKGKDLEKLRQPTLAYGHITDTSGEDLDEVMLSVFPGNRSYTLEESVEISCHGSPVISKAIIELFCRLGARPAEAGEFTLRAYLNGRFDLAQAEAVADLIHAESEQGRKMAWQQLKGNVSHAIGNVRDSLIHFMALLELELDFSEEDVAFANRDELLQQLQQAMTFVQQLIQSFRRGNAIKNGIPMVIAGKPNAGKSTLLNCLLEEDRAIVSDIPGTTRDTIEEGFRFNGLLFRLIDTAGIRTDAGSEIERLGIQRSMDKLKTAEIILYVIDAISVHSLYQIQSEIQMVEGFKEKCMWVMNKSEDPEVIKRARELCEAVGLRKEQVVMISAARKDIEPLLQRLKDWSQELYLQNDLYITNTRHLNALENALVSLTKAREVLISGKSGEWVVFELKMAVESLGSISGKISNNEVLGAIFSRFCIGK